MDDVREVHRVIRQAWRVSVEVAAVKAETAGYAPLEESEPMVELVEPLVEKTEPLVETTEPLVETVESPIEKDEPVIVSEPPVVYNRTFLPGSIPAKAYVIGTELHFELAGKEEEYDAFSRQVDQLARFIKDQFASGELPRNFNKLKGYTYKPALKGKNKSKKGQG